MLSTYAGGGAMDNLNVQGVHARYTVVGYSGTTANVTYSAQANTTLHVSDLDYREVKVNPDEAWVNLGEPVWSSTTNTQTYIARRRCIKQGGADAPEIAIELEIASSAQVRFVDIGLEVGG